jgi:acid phosphatase (class B)
MLRRIPSSIAAAVCLLAASAHAKSAKLDFRCTVLDSARRLRGLEEKIVANATVTLIREAESSRVVIDSPVLSADLRTASPPSWDIVTGRADGHGAWNYFGREFASLTDLEGNFGVGVDRDPGTVLSARVLVPFASAHKNLTAAVVVRYVLKSDPKEPRDAVLERCQFDAKGVRDTFGFRFVTRPSQGTRAKVVGFDVDDTLLWSEPAFRLARQSNAEPFSTPFWRIVNGSDRLVSRVKRVALDLVRAHARAGARIVAITDRPEAGRAEPLRGFLADTFGIAPKDVFFEPLGKVDRLKAEKVELFYGDSDRDLEDAKAAGIPGVRFLRSPHSSHRGDYNVGKFGEEILVGSYDEL